MITSCCSPKVRALPKKESRLPWIFIDGDSQEIFRIRQDDPDWESSEEGRLEIARCTFNIVADDGTSFDFMLQISGTVLKDHSVDDPEALRALITSKGVEIIEGAIHRGVRGNQQILWEGEGVSLIS